METLYKRTIEFLMENDLGYENPHGVVITLLVDLLVNVSVCDPVHKNNQHISLETLCHCKTQMIFLMFLKLKTSRVWEGLNPYCCKTYISGALVKYIAL